MLKSAGCCIFFFIFCRPKKKRKKGGGGKLLPQIHLADAGAPVVSTSYLRIIFHFVKDCPGIIFTEESRSDRKNSSSPPAFVACGMIPSFPAVNIPIHLLVPRLMAKSPGLQLGGKARRPRRSPGNRSPRIGGPPREALNLTRGRKRICGS